MNVGCFIIVNNASHDFCIDNINNPTIIHTKEHTCNWSASFQNLAFRCKDLKRSIMLCMSSFSWTPFSCDNIIVGITSSSQQPPCSIGPLCSPLLSYEIGVISELLSFSTSLKSLHKHFNENINKHVKKSLVFNVNL